MMDSILRIVPHGENVPGQQIKTPQVIRVLQRLLAAVELHNLGWKDVSLLLLVNSKSATSQSVQQESDQSIKDGIDQFCGEMGWRPSLIGCSVFSSFYRSIADFDADISDGLLFVAIASSVFDRIPVVHEVNLEYDERRFAGQRVLGMAIRAFQGKASEMGVDLDSSAVTDSSTGVLFTTGSGHIEAKQIIDFKECYAVGQELLRSADDVGAQLVGGCATNRTQPQLQCLYYSEQVGTRINYRYTYNHAAVLALLPYSRARLQLHHPYKRVEGVKKLDLSFHPRDQYEQGRYFYVRKINGRPPVEFLADYWHFTINDLNRMVVERTAIPAEPDAHWVTIASSVSRRDDRIWPNVPIWLEEVDGEVMMRLVRAEDEDANYYLMELRPESLRENARDLMASLHSNFGEDVSMLTFICESRKYVLNRIGSNAEAQEIISSSPTRGSVVGIYLNGEYSTGATKSIGYHNYSQIGALLPRRSTRDLPVLFGDAKMTAGLELFACHASRDKSTVREFMDAVQSRLHGSTVWLDERELRIGEVLKDRVRAAIGRSNQLFVPFISDRSIESDWVQQELRWAIQQEMAQNRSMVLPVVLDDRGDEVMAKLRMIWEDDLVDFIDNRLQLRVVEFTEEEVVSKARKLADHITSRMASSPTTAPAASDPFVTLGQRPPSDPRGDGDGIDWGATSKAASPEEPDSANGPADGTR